MISIFMTGNGCAHNLANDRHTIVGMHWWDDIPANIREDFFFLRSVWFANY